MEIWTIGVFVLFVLTATAKPEIPSKGKHAASLDARQQGASNEDADMPRFAEPISNVTVSVGRDALLACVVENLKGYKVAWVRVDTQTILSIHHNLISQNSRISLSYNDHRSWYLHIKEVEESDRGWYMCQINTDPMRSRKGYLQVVVPPMIVEGMTSNDLVVREGLNVTLTCKARGYPEPYVMWRREDGEEMLIGGEHVNVVDGEYLHITKVSRLHMAAYLCVASNGVPPSISKRVHLRVQFPPMLSIPNQLEGAYIGQDVVLECHTEAYPASINYWTTERGDMIISDTSRAGDKFETTSAVNGYMKFMKLKIRSVGPNDFGTYRCVAKNSLGETDGNIKLDEMPAPTTSVISEIALWNRTIDGKRRNRNKFDLNALPDYGVEEWRDGAGNDVLNGGGNDIHINGNDNNQTPVRNPPGAFHNSAGGGLAQYNLLGRIIHGIKMQSFGIFQHLSKYFAAKRIESKINDAGMLKRDSERDTPTTEQQKRLLTNQMIVRLSRTDEAMLLNDDNDNGDNDQIPLEIVNLNKSGNVNFYTPNTNTDSNRCHVDGNQMNNKRGNNGRHNKTSSITDSQQKQGKQQQKQHSKLLQSLNNMNINMRRIITYIKYWLEAPSMKGKDVGGKYTAVATRVILKLASLLPTTPAMVAKLICIIIFSISIMLLLLHLIIGGRRTDSSICCRNNINTIHDNTSEKHNSAATSTSSQSICENRLSPLRRPAAQPTPSPPPPIATSPSLSPPQAQSTIPSTKPSSYTNDSHTQITFSHGKRQQEKQQQKPRRQQTNKFNKTTTNTPITVSTHPPPLAKFPGIVLHIFHKLLELR